MAARSATYTNGDVRPIHMGGSSRRVTSLVDQVWAYLRNAIIQGEVQPGQRLVELEIAERMGTSQGPVREALQRLEYEGLVERRARSSSFVTPMSIDEMYELFVVRSVVEGFAVRRTVERITQTQCDELAALLEGMHAAARRDNMMELVNNDMTFHMRICQWSGSRTLYQVWQPLYSQIQRFIMQTHRHYFADLEEIADTHEPLVAVFQARDAVAAEQLLRDHVMLIWSKIEPYQLQQVANRKALSASLASPAAAQE